jgi:hypothetical protein
VKIKNIRADNGVYTAKLFQKSCTKYQQSLTFCAVGAHWQNGITEGFIGSITQRARTILLHVMSRWPQVITEDMWPYAIHHAVTFHNASIRRDKNMSPYELFTGEAAPWNLNDFRVFGCPVYVLQKKLQDGDNFAKWKARSWQGVYVRHYTCHPSSIPLIYNYTTTHVTPQYHIVFNEGFSSIIDPSNTMNDAFFENLYNKASWFHKSNYTDHTDEYYFGSFWMDPPLAPRPENKGRKRKTFTIQPNDTSQNIKDHPIEHEGDSTNLSITNTFNPQAIDPSINIKELEHTIQLHSDPSITNTNQFKQNQVSALIMLRIQVSMIQPCLLQAVGQ